MEMSMACFSNSETRDQAVKEAVDENIQIVFVGVGSLWLHGKKSKVISEVPLVIIRGDMADGLVFMANGATSVVCL